MRINIFARWRKLEARTVNENGEDHCGLRVDDDDRESEVEKEKGNPSFADHVHTHLDLGWTRPRWLQIAFASKCVLRPIRF